MRIAVLLLFLPLCSCQKAVTWDDCKCKWEQWAEWSKCNKRCYGLQIRYRAVWKSNQPKCAALNVCDEGKGSREVQRCNKNCTFGQWDWSVKKCVCPAGKIGVCCDEVVKCGVPQPFVNGRTNGSVFNYSSVVGFECVEGYKLVGADSLSCGLQGWNADIPKCVSRDPCRDNPCPAGRVCVVEDNGKHRCDCPRGMYGDTCNIDGRAPKVVNCSGDVTLNTANRRKDYNWTVPTFVDPGGKGVAVTSNYPSNSFRFPWGDFGIQYIGVRRENGLHAKCEFNVKVRPFQCHDLPPPENGYVVCNTWHSEFGRFCLFGCKSGYTLPSSFDGRQWVVCGSSGQWTPGKQPNKCEEALSTARKPDTLPLIKSCQHKSSVLAAKKLYIDKLRKSFFKSFCSKARDQCNEQNVASTC